VKPSSAVDALIGFVQQVLMMKAQASMKRLFSSMKRLFSSMKSSMVDPFFIDENGFHR